MPRVSIMLIRTALVQLALGGTIGGLLLADKGLQIWPWIQQWRPGHIQIMLFGWIIQFACGVAVWILPRLDAAGGRGDLRLVRVGYAALNAGVALAALHVPLAGAGWMLPAAAGCYLIAIAAIGVHAWRRVLPFGAQIAGNA